MSIIQKEGYPFAFNSRRCSTCPGKCCTGHSGYVWVSIEEIEGMAETLGISFAEFATRYTYRENGRFSLKEVQRESGDFACIFYNQGCKIYEQRPEQCRTFPFWDTFKQKPQLAEEECPGIVPLSKTGQD